MVLHPVSVFPSVCLGAVSSCLFPISACSSFLVAKTVPCRVATSADSSITFLKDAWACFRL
uniref:Uncharacterized protein n=1 Tax=Anguilla anguilla TaxID=7936 RepID=A0A0E9WB49_ANGAN